MHKLKLHVKTTLLASAITIAMLIAALVVTSAGIANLERDDDEALAEIQAIDLARHISDMPAPRDVDTLTTAANLIKGSRPNILSVRIWERSGDDFVERVSAAGSLPPEPMVTDVRETLLRGLAFKGIESRPYAENQPLYRVFSTTFEKGRPAGAVEIVERFDSIWSIAFRYVKSVVWMSVIAIILITLGTYFLFRQLVYQPIEKLLNAMSRAKGGDLNAQVPTSSNDELGMLTQQFNSMLGQVREMTREREEQSVVLRERVHEATSELELRNQQLQETNL